jgi:hypothetical protein
MEDTPRSQQQEPTQTQDTTTTTQLPLTTLKLIPNRSTILSRSQSIEPIKPWYHLFRPSLLGPNGPSSSQSQSQSQSQFIDDRSTTFTFCQNRLITSTEDLSKMIQNAYTTFSQDKEKLESLIDNAKELLQSVRDENATQNEQNMNTSIDSPPCIMTNDSWWTIEWN